MKLISREQIKTREKEKKDVLVAENLALQQSIEKAIAELNKTKDEREKEVQELEERKERLELRHKAFVDSSEIEIAKLLERKREAEAPLDELKKQLELKEIALKGAENKLVQKQYEIAANFEKFEEKFKQNQVERERAELIKKEADEAVKDLNQIRTKIMREKRNFLEMAEKFYAERADWTNTVKVQTKALDGRGRALDGYAQMLNDRESDLNEKQKRLKSERLALDAAKKEIYGTSS